MHLFTYRLQNYKKSSEKSMKYINNIMDGIKKERKTTYSFQNKSRWIYSIIQIKQVKKL